MKNSEVVVACIGMGSDSMGLLTRWIKEPYTRDWPLENLICLTAQTGDEYDVTRRLMETHALPLMRENGIRYVQLARAGQADEDGYDILDDSRSPERMYMVGRWRLSDEMRSAGTVPTFAGGKRWCSWRAKGSVLDRWRADHLPGVRYRHVIGFSAEETWRMERDSSYEDTLQTGSVREPWYPLAEWSWTREVTAGYLHEIFGEPWSRSCCVYCPFQANKAGIKEMVARWRAEPLAAAQALLLEHRALALNPNMTLFKASAAVDVAESYGLEHVLAGFRDLQQNTGWALHDVRRIHHARRDDPTRRGPVWRSVTTVATGTRRKMRTELDRLAAATGAQATLDRYGIARATLIEPATDRYPAPERRLVLAPRGATEKSRPSFANAWNKLLDSPRERISPTSTA